jgi:hypothetical protein
MLLIEYRVPKREKEAQMLRPPKSYSCHSQFILRFFPIAMIVTALRRE